MVFDVEDGLDLYLLRVSLENRWKNSAINGGTHSLVDVVEERSQIQTKGRSFFALQATSPEHHNKIALGS